MISDRENLETKHSSLYIRLQRGCCDGHKIGAASGGVLIWGWYGGSKAYQQQPEHEPAHLHFLQTSKGVL